MNKHILYYSLLFLIIIDIIFTIYGVKYLGAEEVNPLCTVFDTFIIDKTVLSSFGMIGLWLLKDEKHFSFFICLLICVYSFVFIVNLWQTVNYLIM